MKLIRNIFIFYFLWCIIFLGTEGSSKPDFKVSISSTSIATDYERQLKGKDVFYFLKLKHSNNFFSFNIPKKIFEKLTEPQKEKIARFLIGLYDRAFKEFNDIFGYAPEGYKFNVTFGKTRQKVSFNKVYLGSKISNIFPNFLPYNDGQNVLTENGEKIMLHEIGHSLFAIGVGTLEHPKTKAIEEGFVDYIAGERVAGEIGEVGIDRRIPISQIQAERMKGLTQLDIEASLWGEEIALKPSGHKGYVGLTHHTFGIEFINIFIDTYGKEHSAEFLVRLKATDKEPSSGDFGTKQIQNIFTKMGFSYEEVVEFENELHTRLKKNIFKIK